MPQDPSTSYYPPGFLFRLIMGFDDGADTTHQRPHQVPKHLTITSNPIPSPHDDVSFHKMFDQWMMDYFYFKAHPVNPGLTLSTITSIDGHSSETVATHENRAVGIVKVDSLGQQHLLPSNMETLKEGFFPGNPKGSVMQEWLVWEFKARGVELRRWWKDPSNHQLASQLQKRYVFRFGERWQAVRDDPSTWAKSLNILAGPFRTREQAVANISKYPINTTSLTEGTPTEESQLGSRPTATPDIPSDAISDVMVFTLPVKVKFGDLMGLVHFDYGLRILWDQNRDRFPFHFEVKILVIDFPEFGSNDLRSDRVLPPRWSVQTTHVPFHCDSERFINHLEGLAPNVGALCKRYEMVAVAALVSNLAALTKKQMEPIYGRLKFLHKRGIHDKSGWWYSNLCGDKSDTEIYLKLYVKYASPEDFEGIMDIVRARNIPIVAQADTISTLRFISKIAAIDNIARELLSSTSPDSEGCATRDAETGAGNPAENDSYSQLALENEAVNNDAVAGQATDSGLGSLGRKRRG